MKYNGHADGQHCALLLYFLIHCHKYDLNTVDYCYYGGGRIVLSVQ